MQNDVATVSIGVSNAEFIPVTKWPHGWPTQGAWRALIFNAGERVNSRGDRIPGNGLIEAGAIRRVGRRVLVNPTKFFAWVESKGA